MADESSLSENQKVALKQLRDANGGTVNIANVHAAALKKAGFAVEGDAGLAGQRGYARIKLKT